MRVRAACKETSRAGDENRMVILYWFGVNGTVLVRGYAADG
jgi:hypothetical protein